VYDRSPQAKPDFAGYRIRVAAWAAAGYAALLAAVLVTVAGVAGIVAAVVVEGAPVIALKLAIPIAVVAWIIIRSLLVKIDPPTGITLRRSAAPVLFGTIDRLRAHLGSPRVHRVLLDVVRKRVQHLAHDLPMYVIAFKRKTVWTAWSSATSTSSSAQRPGSHRPAR